MKVNRGYRVHRLAKSREQAIEIVELCETGVLSRSVDSVSKISTLGRIPTPIAPEMGTTIAYPMD